MPASKGSTGTDRVDVRDQLGLDVLRCDRTGPAAAGENRREQQGEHDDQRTHGSARWCPVSGGLPRAGGRGAGRRTLSRVEATEAWRGRAGRACPTPASTAVGGRSVDRPASRRGDASRGGAACQRSTFRCRVRHRHGDTGMTLHTTTGRARLGARPRGDDDAGLGRAAAGPQDRPRRARLADDHLVPHGGLGAGHRRHARVRGRCRACAASAARPRAARGRGRRHRRQLLDLHDRPRPDQPGQRAGARAARTGAARARQPGGLQGDATGACSGSASASWRPGSASSSRASYGCW